MSIQTMISSIFGGPNTQTQPQQQATPGNIPPNTGMPANPLPNTATNGLVPEQPTPEATPLDEFKDLWKNEPVDPNAKPVDNTVFGPVDGEALLKTASTIDFTKVIDSALSARIQAGGEDGLKATLEAMNKVQQLGYAQSAHASTKLIEQAIAKTQEKFIAQLPQLIRDTNASNLIKETPAYAHPAAAPLIESLTAQMQVKYPNSTPAELRDMANRYVLDFAKSVTPKKEDPKVAKEEDFSNFLIGS
jgi:hypothetical protein